MILSMTVRESSSLAVILQPVIQAGADDSRLAHRGGVCRLDADSERIEEAEDRREFHVCLPHSNELSQAWETPACSASSAWLRPSSMHPSAGHACQVM